MVWRLNGAGCSLNAYSKPAFFWKDAMGLGRCMGPNATGALKIKILSLL